MDDEYGDLQDFHDILESSEALSRTSKPAPPQPTARTVQPTPKVVQPTPKVQQPKPQALPARRGPSSILVSSRQKGNPILSHIRLMPWEYTDTPADYVLGTTTCALFLSLKYHKLHPEYIYTRIKGLAGKFRLRVLLTMVDIPNHEDSLKELSKTCLVNNLTIILCWSTPEAAHYLELFKSSEHAQPTAIRSRQAQSYKDSLVEFVTVPRSINKSDAASLMSTFGTLRNAVNAQPEQISAVPGWGERKVQQWTSAVQEDFRTEKASKKSAPPRRGRAPEEKSKKRDDRDKDGDADEAALEVFREAETEAQGSRMSGRPPTAEEGLSDGVLAALSKYRSDAG